MKKLAMLAVAFALSLSGRTTLAHCQIPCGIYDDQMRIGMLREDIDTVEKSMKAIVDLSAREKPDMNQLVRWVMNKEEHAEKIRAIVTDYFLTQRVKVPGDGEPDTKYVTQLSLLHRLLVTAMKMKQTTDLEFVAKARKLVDEFAAAYFTPEELKHLEEHR